MIKNYKKSLIEPLDKEELHIFHSSDSLDRCISEIYEIINNKVHGAYLIGGIRGVGKTSLINLCCEKYRYSDLVRINLDCNKIINIENFIYFFVEALRKSIQTVDLPEEIFSEIENISKKIISNYSSKITSGYDNNKSQHIRFEDVDENNIDLNLNIFKFFGQAFNIRNAFGQKISKSSIAESSKKNCHIQEIEERNDIFILIEKLTIVLKKIATCEKKYRIVITVDELDKHNESFIEELFDYYKNLFLNSHIITFFIVDAIKYINIRNKSEIENKLLSYFIKCIYVPTLEHKDVKDYMYREFEIESYKNIMEVDYLTFGIFRKMNTYKYQHGYNGKYIFAQAFIYYIFTSEEEQDTFFEGYTYDLYKYFVKELIQYIFRQKRITLKYICDYFEKKMEKFNVYIDYNNFIIKRLDELSLKYNFVTVTQLSSDYKVYDFILENFKEYKILDDYMIQKIEYKLNSRDCRNINKYIYRRELFPVTITDHKTEAFYYAIRFIETMGKFIDNVIIVEKISTFMDGEVFKYSAILIINKPVGKIVYIIDDCSFSYEGPLTVNQLIKFMRVNNIKLIKIETDDEPVKENLEYILEKTEEQI
ncbi:P-loop NTPase fold protein [Oceanirhabdus sp. W0125-5]|uniref:P-loop NTPase fold protein n=1 Tax=Oceanirhabdus sp. W0125-5 TaxID=2999116 RepID=UPI0022F330CF|nr:P-loop NTPase fold protein [Oceanirhabdus sp. W0125-5]WBW96232.1 P-loop NTPase fold protein [Oceanirhabdus sp. W0125-5]